jgi:hypothetical protein
MDQIYPDQGLVRLLERMTAADLVYRLFTNDVDPDQDTELGDLTEQVGDGYAAVTVEAADWTLGSVTAHIGTLIAGPISFTPTGSAWTIYGYYVTDVAGTELLAVGRFDGAPITQAVDDPLLITAVMGDFSKFPL